MRRGARKILYVSLVSAAVAAGIALYTWREYDRPPVFELFVFDTAGSPSVFIRTEDDRRILINGGANAGVVRELTRVLPYYSRRIDRVVSTNEDLKYSTGIKEVEGRYTVGTHATTTGLANLHIIDKKKSILLYEAAGKRILIIPFNPATLTKRLLAEAQPDYLIYSATPPSKKKSGAKEKPDILAGILVDHRFNIRETGGVRVTETEGRVTVGPLR